jgi:hypothetical protein
MRPIPKSRIQENLYTNGTGIGGNVALRYVSDKKLYVGLYNIVNGNKYSTGKTFDDNSKSLETYNILTKVASAVAAAGSVPTLRNSLINSRVPSNSIRYFYKDLRTSTINIKEIDKNAYNQLIQPPSPNYQTISYDSNTQTLEEVNNQMPGLTAFLVA